MDITDIVYFVLTLLSLLFSYLLVPYIKSRMSREKYERLTAFAKTAVLAAEKIYKGSGRGEEKKAFVLEYLGKHGYTLDADLISGELELIIEAAVCETEK